MISEAFVESLFELNAFAYSRAVREYQNMNYRIVDLDGMVDDVVSQLSNEIRARREPADL